MEQKKTEAPKPAAKPVTPAPTAKPAATQQPKAKVDQRKR